MDIELVKKTILDKFFTKGGYDLVKLGGKAWRGIAEAQRQTGISEMTIRRLLKEYPTPPKVPQGRRIWITPEQDLQLEEAISQLEKTCKQLENIGKYFEQSLIVDLAELRARKELQGWTTEQFQDSLRKQVEKDEKKKNNMEQLFNDTLGEIISSLSSLRRTTNSLSHT